MGRVCGRLAVQRCSGVTTVVSVGGNSPVRRLQEGIHAKTGIHPNQQVLLHNGTLIDCAHLAVESCGIQNQSTVHLLARVRGGGLSVDAAFDDLCQLRRCTHRCHRFSPGIQGRALLGDGDRCATLGHWGLVNSERVEPTSFSSASLIAACGDGRLEALEYLIHRCGMDVCGGDATGWTPLHTAMALDQEDLVRKLLASGAEDVATHDGVRASALNKALWLRLSGQQAAGDPWEPPADATQAANEIVEMITERRDSTETLCRRVCAAVRRLGPSVLDSVGTSGIHIEEYHMIHWTIFTGATWLGEDSLFRVCLALGADVDAATPGGQAPLWIACQRGRMDRAQVLLEHDASEELPQVPESPLWVACATGNLDRVKSLLRGGACADCPNRTRDNPLDVASRNGHVDSVRVLLDHGASVEWETSIGDAILTRTCAKGQARCAQLLLERGAAVDKGDCGGGTALHSACRNNHADCAAALRRYGATVDCETEHEETPLFLACESGSVECCRLLLDHGADTAKSCGGDEEEISPLYIACKRGRLECVELLLDRGAYVDQMIADGSAPLDAACREGHVECARLLLDRGANASKCCYNNGAPLLSACYAGHVDCVRLLLDRGADMDNAEARGIMHAIPLVAACRAGNVECARLLLSRGARDSDPKARVTPLWVACAVGDTDRARSLLNDGWSVEESDCSLLWIACQNGFAECTKLLLEAGATADVRQSSFYKGQTPLFVACKNGHVDCVRALVGHGADVEMDTYTGATPLLIACKQGNANCARVLLDHGANVGKADRSGLSPLHVACKDGIAHCARLLLARGASVDQHGRRGRTPLHEACYSNRRSTALVLLEHGADPCKQDDEGTMPAPLAWKGIYKDRQLAEAVSLASRDRDAGIDLLRRIQWR